MVTIDAGGGRWQAPRMLGGSRARAVGWPETRPSGTMDRGEGSQASKRTANAR